MKKPQDIKAIYWKKFYKKNIHYHKDILSLVTNIIPRDASVLEIGSKGGELLIGLPNKVKFGIESDNELLKLAKKRFGKKAVFLNESNKKIGTKKFDYVVLNHTLSETRDVLRLIDFINKHTHKDSRVLVIYFNYFWKPILDTLKILGLRMPDFSEPNWLSGGDIENFFYLNDYQKIKSGKRFLFPFNLGKISTFLNKFLSPIPIIDNFNLTFFEVYRKVVPHKNLSVSIVIPARNESGNIKGVLSKIPFLSKKMEVIFVEGNSTDDTYDVIQKEIKRYKGSIKASLYKQKGKGKGNAVRLGFSKAKNDLLMILDADLTVAPIEMKRFYKAAIENRGEMIMGSRLIYPMEKLAMRTLNIIGNKFFGIAFSYLLNQRIKDTLCGTKVLLRKDYLKIANNRKVFGDFDPFGDFDLIFGAARLNMKILEIPIRYKERVYGTTNISRFTHGWLLLKMVAFAARTIKFI